MHASATATTASRASSAVTTARTTPASRVGEQRRRRDGPADLVPLVVEEVPLQGLLGDVARAARRRGGAGVESDVHLLPQHGAVLLGRARRASVRSRAPSGAARRIRARSSIRSCRTSGAAPSRSTTRACCAARSKTRSHHLGATPEGDSVPRSRGARSRRRASASRRRISSRSASAASRATAASQGARAAIRRCARRCRRAERRCASAPSAPPRPSASTAPARAATRCSSRATRTRGKAACATPIRRAAATSTRARRATSCSARCANVHACTLCHDPHDPDNRERAARARVARGQRDLHRVPREPRRRGGAARAHAPRSRGRGRSLRRVPHAEEEHVARLRLGRYHRIGSPTDAAKLAAIARSSARSATPTRPSRRSRATWSALGQAHRPRASSTALYGVARSERPRRDARARQAARASRRDVTARRPA